MKPPAVEWDVEGHRLLFTLDTGASGTDFSARYYELFHNDAAHWQTPWKAAAPEGPSKTRCTFSQTLR